MASNVMRVGNVEIMSLSDGMLEGHEIICPLHGGSFDIRTGEAVSEPCVEPIGTYECRVENGDVFVKMAGA